MDRFEHTIVKSMRRLQRPPFVQGELRKHLVLTLGNFVARHHAATEHLQLALMCSVLGVVKNLHSDQLLSQKSRATVAEEPCLARALAQALAHQSQRERMEKEFSVLTFVIGANDHIAARHIANTADLIALGLQHF